MIAWSCLCIVVAVVYCVLILYYNTHWKVCNVESSQSIVSVSVIIPVRNEEKNILNLLKEITKQADVKGSVEVIVVDDNSEDNTYALVERYILEHPGISICRLEGYSKKAALEKGIALAKGELIITVDGDCSVQPGWIKTYIDIYSETKPCMMTGPVRLFPVTSFTEQFQQLDYMALQMCGLSSLQVGKPLLCSGANLAFQRACFHEVNGYEGNRDVASGDDVFLMMKMQERFGTVKAAIHPDLVVSSWPEKTWAAFYNQRKRWGSKLKHYRNVYIKLTGLFLAVFYLLIIINLLAGIFYAPPLYLLLCMMTVKLLVDLILLRRGAPLFGVRLKTGLFFLSSLIYPFVFVVLTAGALSKGFKWKGRQVAQ